MRRAAGTLDRSVVQSMSMTKGTTRRRLDPWIWVAALSILGFAVLAMVVDRQGAVAFDAPVTAFVKGLPVPTDAWLALTFLGGAILVPIGVATVVALLWRRRPWTALIYGIALAGASAWTYVIKVTIERARPPGEPLIAAPGFSFPSGHSLNSAVTYGLIALLVWRSHLPAWVRLTTAVALAALVVAIGLSRIALGVHYPSDVLGGWLAGLSVVATVALFTSSTADG
jgi:undecaprenyl-diphosphatase